jgi:signal transduction histidine kinase
MRRPPIPPPFDLALAAGLTALGQWEAWTTTLSGSQPLRAACVALVTVPVALRRTAPVTAMWIGASGLVIEGLAMDAMNSLAELLAGLALAYAVARYAPVERAVLAIPPLVLGIVVHRVASPGSRSAVDVIFDVVFVTAAWSIGAAARSRHLRAEQAELRAEQVEAGRAAAEREAALAERLRIARELHDIVAHALGVIAVQAGAAEAVMERDPDEARTTIASIRERARDSVVEMRGVLGVLRESENGRGPQPTLHELPALVERARAGGLEVELVIEGPERSLAPSVELSAYRIVQEALTNVTRHARATHVSVRLRFEPHSLAIEVTDDGRGPDGDTRGSGLGLVGVRERATLLGGTFEAGPREGGGYALRAELPLNEAAR